MWPGLPTETPLPLLRALTLALTSPALTRLRAQGFPKAGPPELRRALFLVMDCLLKTQPQDDPVYRFMDKKRAEGKPYLVYMTAGANKFLRIYYGRVKEYLASLEEN